MGTAVGILCNNCDHLVTSPNLSIFKPSERYSPSRLCTTHEFRKMPAWDALIFVFCQCLPWLINAHHSLALIIPDNEQAISLIPDPFPSLFLVDNTYVCIYSINKQLCPLLQLYLSHNKYSLPGGEEGGGSLLFIKGICNAFVCYIFISITIT